MFLNELARPPLECRAPVRGPGVVAVAAGTFHIFALLKSGTLVDWGTVQLRLPEELR